VQDVRNVAAIEPPSNAATVERPWGRYTVLEEAAGYKLKRIVVDPGQKLSLHRHKQPGRALGGARRNGEVVKGEEEIVLHKNESTFIPIGEKHRLQNPETSPLIIHRSSDGD
jgi:mannose-6-phosphate isomerase-like protein (cupin superfamily)